MDTIVMLKGAERVRRRPAVCFGDTGVQGACNAVEELFAILSYEKATKLDIAYENGVIALQNNGKGLYLAQWEDLFNLKLGLPDRKMQYSPFTPSRQAPASRYDGMGYHDSTLYMVTCVCRDMEIRSVRDGKAYTLRFHKGENVGGLETVSCDAPSGTRFTFSLDPEVFGNVNIPRQFFTELAQGAAVVHPRCQVNLQVGEKKTAWKGGMQAWLEKQCPGAPVYTASCRARGKERYNRETYGASVRVALAFAKEKGFVKVYHNQKTLWGGVHVDRILEQVQKQIGWRLERPVEEILPHVCLVVSTTATPYATCWRNGTRKHMDNKMIGDMAEDLFGDDFAYFCARQEALLEELFPKKSD